MIIPCAWSSRSLIHFSIPFWWWALTPQYCTLCFWSFALVVNEFSANLPLWHVSSAKLPYVFLHTSQKTPLPSWVQCNTDSFAWVQTTGLINGQQIWLPTCTYILARQACITTVSHILDDMIQKIREITNIWKSPCQVKTGLVTSNQSVGTVIKYGNLTVTMIQST